MMMNIISGSSTSSSNAAGIMAFIPPLPRDEHSFQSHLIIPNHHLNYEDSMLRRSSACSSFADIMPWDHDDDTWSSDEGSLQLGEKKRKKKKKKKSRVSTEQVKALEKSFQLGTKLEPERKMQLARDLGLQPRQIAIWFQNRRARSKTKQLEKDYDSLKTQFQLLSAHNHALKSHNNILRSQLLALRNRESNSIGPTFTRINLNQETEYSSWNTSNNNNLNENNMMMIDTNHVGVSASSNKHVFSPHSVGTHHLLHPLSSISDDPQRHAKVDQTVRDEAYCDMFGTATNEFLAMPAATTPFPSNFSFS